MRKLVHPDLENIKLSSVLYALSDPLRLKMVMELLENGELSYKELNNNLPKSTRSHHFKVLRENGVTFTDIRGIQSFVSLRQTDLEKRFPGLLNLLYHAANQFNCKCSL
ncbi:helix-turn-helix transcriptional regulator [Bacillus thuringiensis]|nr:helix-turn-helix transcriptional regulator [Bacillus thuringiensis]